MDIVCYVRIFSQEKYKDIKDNNSKFQRISWIKPLNWTYNLIVILN